jgi:hypothetical protein
LGYEIPVHFHGPLFLAGPNLATNRHSQCVAESFFSISKRRIRRRGSFGVVAAETDGFVAAGLIMACSTASVTFAALSAFKPSMLVSKVVAVTDRIFSIITSSVKTQRHHLDQIII